MLRRRTSAVPGYRRAVTRRNRGDTPSRPSAPIAPRQPGLRAGPFVRRAPILRAPAHGQRCVSPDTDADRPSAALRPAAAADRQPVARRAAWADRAADRRVAGYARARASRATDRIDRMVCCSASLAPRKSPGRTMQATYQRAPPGARGTRRRQEKTARENRQVRFTSHASKRRRTGAGLLSNDGRCVSPPHARALRPCRRGCPTRCRTRRDGCRASSD